MSKSLTELHTLLQDLPDLESISAEILLLKLKQGITVPVNQILTISDLNQPLEWFKRLNQRQIIFLNNARNFCEIRDNAWSNMVFMDEEYLLEILDGEKVVSSESLTPLHLSSLACADLKFTFKFTLVKEGKFRTMRLEKEIMLDYNRYLQSLHQDLAKYLTLKGSIPVVKKWMRVLGLLGVQENPYFKTHQDLEEFIYSRPVNLIPVKDCLHLVNTIENLYLTQEIGEHIFLESPAQQYYRKTLLDVIKSSF